jgi:tRNA nucleotidyltransferase (CCA-adding enzyme)
MNNPVETVRRIFPACYLSRIFLVGGCVRDLLLGRIISDIDLISTLTPHEMSACGFRLVSGKSTVPIWFLHDDVNGSVEATMIADVNTLSADLGRRDFTINAVAMTLAREFIDPLNGRIDLNLRQLRACSPQTFRADPLRIFRALRFEADGWCMEPATEDLIRERDWLDAWPEIPIERFTREMLKAFKLRDPEQFFKRMLEFKVGEPYLPEIFRMLHIPAGPLIHHPEGDLFTHSIQVLQRVALRTFDPLTRFCAMFHDIGKLATPSNLYPKHHGHDQAGFVLSKRFCQRLRLPAHYGDALSWVSRLHGTFNLWDQLRDKTKLRIADQAIKAGIVDVLPMVAAADKLEGGEPEEWRYVVEIAGMSAIKLGIDVAKLELISPKKRTDFILQTRIKKLSGHKHQM